MDVADGRRCGCDDADVVDVIVAVAVHHHHHHHQQHCSSLISWCLHLH